MKMLTSKALLAGLLSVGVWGLSHAEADAINAEPSQEVSFPTDKSILFWSQDQRLAAFAMMDKIAPTRVISAGPTPSTLALGTPLAVQWKVGDQAFDTDRYMQEQNSVGVIILQGGKIRFEEYRDGHSAEQRWTSFSVAKSLTSSLVGAALKDGDIASIDDPVTRYIPELIGSGYDGVSVEQLLTMRSGVAWTENYADPESDVVKFGDQPSVDGVDPTVLYMKELVRDAEPGTRWQYNTGETNLIGVLVSKATGKTLSDYLSEKVWKPYGMSSDAYWVLNAGGSEIAGCCLSATLRDYARVGLFALGDGKVDGESVVSDGWFQQAGHKQADIGQPGFGYGYQWWTYDDGSYAAQGIFGQGIFIDPKRDLVIASHSNWKVASGDDYKNQRNQFYWAVQRAIDAEITQ
ncbi:serine hydrolase domain-containing protein [Arenicella xantha]|uniref:CubicO group peptidase (Beta-lactamase class C family) n=1 Tax=Arenicella xantha TaxID=644221 RepID=A0A395JNV7_9GAMM|nr:serine hydrolase [Arenicella xantha]RBP53187.1 CubicO group peptidase (beta-lactamase class C family) [Arenicella xantha]